MEKGFALVLIFSGFIYMVFSLFFFLFLSSGWFVRALSTFTVFFLAFASLFFFCISSFLTHVCGVSFFFLGALGMCLFLFLRRFLNLF